MLAGFWGLSGRINRAQWWLVQVVVIVLTFLIITMGVGDQLSEGSPSLGSSLALLAISLASLVINICSTVKRFHDRDKSGWWFLLSFVPLIGGLWVFIECGFCSGDDAPNRFGEPPGAAARAAALDQEVSSMGAGRMAKIDDDYLQNYAKQVAQRQAAAQNAPAAPSFGRAGAPAVFGKR